MKRKISILIFISGIYSVLHAQPPEPGKYCSFGVFYDNDYSLSGLGLNEDRNYSMGLGLNYSSSGLTNWIIYAPHRWLFKKIKPKRYKEGVGFYSFMFANGSFTPDSLPATYPILNDRPYASLTYFQTNSSFLDIDKHKMTTIGISIGMLGTCISKEVQTTVHNMLNYDTPEGWEYQISNGGSPTFLMAYQEDLLLTKKPLKEREKKGATSSTKRFGGEWKGGWKLNVGWYNTVAGEISFRFGCIDPRNWTYNVNPLGPSNLADKDSTFQRREKYYLKKRKGEVYFFTTLRTNLVIYNVLLSGQGGKDAVNIPNSEVRHGVLDGAAGVCLSPVLGHTLNVDLKGKFNFRSPEFEAPGRKPRWHYWGGLELIVSFFHK